MRTPAPLGRRFSEQQAITYGHDQANRMTGLSQGGIARAQSYDLAGNLTLGRGGSLGDAYTYRYDHLNQLTAVYDSAGTTRKGAFAHDALGRRVQFTCS